ncbi:MAG: ABC transporter ATP-binding protein, partial [Anaerolineales bacterium]|nr:ABC transporter ATP-binding protein [Anaerolineales bacterium]
KPSSLLLLDEPTAHLDTITERAVMQAIIAGLRGASLLLITHRLVGMPAMDEILVLEQGRVIERGTHRELLARQGRYRRMWDTQNRFENNE